ncbi:YncE family protein, partial [Patulibacter medicamentivorans]|uniref:YncE family protein n=1 Tax=Patulibacter medicamentivorans TaxID=1097667 RepID=UPI001B8C525C
MLPSRVRPRLARALALTAVGALGPVALLAPAGAEARTVALADGSSRVRLLDLRSLAPQRTARVPGRSYALAFGGDGAQLYVGAGHGVVAVDPSTGAVGGSRPTGITPRGLAVATASGRVVAGGGRRLVVLEPGSLARGATITLERGAGVTAVAVDASGSRALVA